MQSTSRPIHCQCCRRNPVSRSGSGICDRIHIDAGDDRHVYEVEANFVVQEEGASTENRAHNAQWIGPTPDERLTLVTCFPPWSNTHRTIVIARPVHVGEGLVIADPADVGAEDSNLE